MIAQQALAERGGQWGESSPRRGAPRGLPLSIPAPFVERRAATSDGHYRAIVESAIDFHDLLTDGEELEVRAVVADNVETKGHLMVVLDVQMMCVGTGARIATCKHTAIYEPRQVREAK